MLADEPDRPEIDAEVAVHLVIGFDLDDGDLPGFGATPAPESAWGSPDYAEWAAEILRDTGSVASRPVLVGHSFGGRVAVHLAAKHPELIGGLVLTGVPLYRIPSAGKPRLNYRLGRWAHRRGLIPEARMEALRQKYGSADYRAASGVMREVLVTSVNEEYADQVEAIAALGIRVRLVWGEHDTAAPVWMAERALEVLGAVHDDATLTIVAGSAHLLDAGLVTELRSAIGALS